MTNTKQLSVEDFIWVPIDQIVVPPEGIIEHRKDSWWGVNEDDCVGFFNPRRRSDGRRMQRGLGTAQGHPSRELVEKLAEDRPWVKRVVLIPSAFWAIKIADYV